ncbi:MAG: hypothetical protein JXR63_11970 [Spirochaetales bacterium]|nr:hypothetical protein [Spirochaetales bacterium]
MKRVVFFAFIFLTFSVQAQVESDYLQGNFWCMEYRVGDAGFHQWLNKSEMEKKILSNANYFFSGMIYGYNFRYIPFDKVRGIAEEFEYSQIANITDQSRAKIVQQEFDQDRLTAIVIFTMDLDELQKYSAWSHYSNEDSAGTGEFSMFENDDTVLKAFGNSCRDAIRTLLREKLKNKPGEVFGKFSLKEVPRFHIDSGHYICQVKIMLKVDRVEPIGVY